MINPFKVLRASLGISSILIGASSQPAWSASSYKVVWQFNGNTSGGSPTSSLLDAAGVLYGTTEDGGGGNSVGVIYSFYPTSGDEVVLDDFSYGGPSSYAPDANLISVGGTLYGTTRGDGVGSCQSPYCGAVFSVDPITYVEKAVYVFGGGKDGAVPDAGLINVDGTLYGTTSRGGAVGAGTVFAVNLSTGAERVLYSFRGTGGGTGPKANLIFRGGALYGTTEKGGTGTCAHGCGTVFALNPRTGAETVVYSFAGGSDGASPIAGVFNAGAVLYGTTSEGGTGNCSYGCGTVFAVNLRTGSESVLHSFASGNDGETPSASVIDVKGTLYGTTKYGGDGGRGTLFALNLKTGHETILHAFQRTDDGTYPEAGLIEVGGTLYGTTNAGGYADSGTIFAYTP